MTPPEFPYASFPWTRTPKFPFVVRMLLSRPRVIKPWEPIFFFFVFRSLALRRSLNGL